ncbi:aromatic acid exporter family protein [Clostridium boliviensis]|uniref:Aromatic acid exporter family protein n=1 Tax=Clostridium boliviensis TaxID=318465 RepID=A0ABU4GWJ9_9CLOT|nr:aromatic acid exporter family protein [Clostridium boliviensis]MDW2800592.1 aromatic acid exporter family protein [Clostridium boliviensis]
MNKDTVIKSLKIAVAAVLSIALAGELGLRYSATAGIITVLSIQNTKKETIKSARNRTLAFVCALLIARLLFGILGFTLPAFAGYLFLFALLCFYADWGEAIAMDSVLITHFLTERSMAMALIANEAGLFLIGTTVGILVNLHLRRRKDEFQMLSDEVDHQIKEILSQMSCFLYSDDKTSCRPADLLSLQKALRAAKASALTNYNNALFKKDTYEIDYIEMRRQQSILLSEIYVNIRSISCLPKEAMEVSRLLIKIEQGYHRNNTVEGLLKDLDLLLLELKDHALPFNRDEFEARAILFYILKQLHRLLLIKREFILNHSS